MSGVTAVRYDHGVMSDISDLDAQRVNKSPSDGNFLTTRYVIYNTWTHLCTQCSKEKPQTLQTGKWKEKKGKGHFQFELKGLNGLSNWYKFYTHKLLFNRDLLIERGNVRSHSSA